MNVRFSETTARLMIVGCLLFFKAGNVPLIAQQGANGFPSGAVSPAESRAAYQHFLALNGKWIGKSTKGWEEKITYTSIAGKSVVMENSFDAHPNEEMITMIHLDGGRLLLTHYCVAKNQPRLLLTGAENGGKKLTFTFLDGTNMKNRNTGHMDKVVFNFMNDSTFTSQWTWYQDGKESWMEEIHHKRILDAAAE